MSGPFRLMMPAPWSMEVGTVAASRGPSAEAHGAQERVHRIAAISVIRGSSRLTGIIA